MPPINEGLRNELLAMAREDLSVRQRLAEDENLFDGYHPEMERVHLDHAARLSEVIDDHGWPDSALVGEDGAESAWLVLQHAIPCPDLQRRCLKLMKAAAAEGRIDSRHVAMLEDRIRVFERRPQLFGTQYDWDQDGELSPHPIEDPQHVDERRLGVGLPPLAQATRLHREHAEREGQTPPKDQAASRERRERWERHVVWRT